MFAQGPIMSIKGREAVILMQDEVRSQGPLTIYEAIYTHFANIWADWIATSPDLNRIENVWTRNKKNVFTKLRPKD